MIVLQYHLHLHIKHKPNHYPGFIVPTTLKKPSFTSAIPNWFSLPPFVGNRRSTVIDNQLPELGRKPSMYDSKSDFHTKRPRDLRPDFGITMLVHTRDSWSNALVTRGDDLGCSLQYRVSYRNLHGGWSVTWMLIIARIVLAVRSGARDVFLEGDWDDISCGGYGRRVVWISDSVYRKHIQFWWGRRWWREWDEDISVCLVSIKGHHINNMLRYNISFNYLVSEYHKFVISSQYTFLIVIRDWSFLIEE